LNCSDTFEEKRAMPSLEAVLKIFVASVLIVALIAAGRWAVEKMTGGARDVVEEPGGTFTAPNE